MLPRRRQALFVKSQTQWVAIEPPAFADKHFPSPTTFTRPTALMARVHIYG
jgi:hypothetical protein